MRNTLKRKNLSAAVRLILCSVLLATGGLAVGASPAAAQIVCDFSFVFCIGDVDPIDDEPGQKDLNQVCLDDFSSATTDSVIWHLDEVTGFSGANTGDVCALYDTDADGDVNFALCETVESVIVCDEPGGDCSGSSVGDPCGTSGACVEATEAITDSPRLYSCGDDNPDRCSQPVDRIFRGTCLGDASEPCDRDGVISDGDGLDGDCIVKQGGTATDIGPCVILAGSAFQSDCFSEVVAGADPFIAEPAHCVTEDQTTCEDDTVTSCCAVLSDVGSGVVTNVCSYPSEQPNSDPSDCVFVPGSGFITIVKSCTNDPGAGDLFDITVDGLAAELECGEQVRLPLQPETYDLNEATPPSGWAFSGASCVGSSNNNGTPGETGVAGVEVSTADEIVCTFENTYDPCLDPATGEPVDCTGSDRDCGIASCDPAGAQGNCDILEPVTDGRTCRTGSGDLCDPDEVCDGSNTECPIDVVAPATTICNEGSGDLCDPDESCTGEPGAACPDDTYAPATTICRPGSGDICDPDESCTGNPDEACPDDVVAPATTICNEGSGDLCDPDESCTGEPGAACPDDTYAPATTICRPGSGDICDPDESCTGNPDEACPDDVVAPATTICNEGSGDLCDPDESCTGEPGAACPDDTYAPATTICRPGSGDICDPDESCTGNPDEACPDDVVAPATTICNEGSGDLCDPDESCTGEPGAACPDDTYAPATTICRPGSGDICDPDESCTGEPGAACPDDVVAPATTICNEGSGDICDPDESCTGEPGAACPDDVVAPATTICNEGSGDLCDPDESCTGEPGAACPDDVVAPATTICNEGSGDLCDPDESCTGEPGAACPDDTYAPATTICRPGSGDICDPDESCTGNPDEACPDDVVAPATTICNEGSGDLCDPDESCTGEPGAACPDDTYAPATTICRPGSGDICDPDESCTGEPGAACPDDVVAPATTICNEGSGDICDPDESCTGEPGAACPDDVVAPATTICNEGSGDLCDPDESCTGEPGAACPDDVVAPATTICNEGSGDICDPDESCTGNPDEACPDDVITPATTICNPSIHACDPAESCPGVAGAACPDDFIEALPTLTVTKDLINDNGGTLGKDAFTIDLAATQDGAALNTSFTGDLTPALFTLDPEPYTVSEVLGILEAFYAVTFSGDCVDQFDGTADGDLSCNENADCTVVNNDIAQQGPSIIVDAGECTLLEGNTLSGSFTVTKDRDVDDPTVLITSLEIASTYMKGKKTMIDANAVCTFDPSAPHEFSDVVTITYECTVDDAPGGVKLLKSDILVNIFGREKTFINTCNERL